MGAYVGGKKILDLSRATIRGNVDFNGGNLTNVGTLQGTTIIAGAKSVVGYQNYVEADPATLVASKDVERKFWKDDFSVDSSSQYTGDVANFTWDTANKNLTFPSTKSKQIAHPIPWIGGHRLRFVFSTTNATQHNPFIFAVDDLGKNYGVGITSNTFALVRNGLTTLWPGWTAHNINPFDGNKHAIVIEITSSEVRAYFEESPGAVRTGSLQGLELTFVAGVWADTSNLDDIIYEITATPSISYADNFAADTTERYQVVTGTVAYDNTNKRMNVTTATGANGKASGRLKSYKFCEGAQQYDVTLPTGADGDFICLVTHSANGLMTDGIGVGLQSDGNGNWNLATLSNTTVTEGASSGLVDGKTARIEIEKDLSGAYWYYIYDAAGTKPTTATGKLFTTKSEGYTGWYANGNSKTYAIDNISIRAESIVGRTNVEVTEPFWFRDEFGEDSRARYYNGTSKLNAPSGGAITFSTFGSPVLAPTKTFENFEIEQVFTPVYTGASPSAALGIFLLVNKETVGAEGYVAGNQSWARINWTGAAWNINYRRYANSVQAADSSVVHAGLTSGTEYKFKVVKTGTTFNVYLAESSAEYGDALLTYTDSGALTSGYSGFLVYDNGATGFGYSLSTFQISGTRVYNKPIHRGAMAETVMLDGIETVATTIAYDFNWDCIGEFSGVSSSSVDVVNGRLTLADTDYIYPTGHSAGLGYYQYRIMRSAASGSIELYVAGNVISITNAGAVSFNGGAAESYTIAVTAATLVAFDVGATSIAVYADGVLKGTKTGLTITSSNPKMKRTTADFYVSQMIVVALSPDAIDGFAPSLAGVGGGARFDAVEYIQSTLVNAAKYGKYLLSACCKTTDSDAEAAELYFKNSTDDTDITSDASDTETIALADTNYADFTKDLVLNYDDIDDTVDLRVRRTTATTHNQPPVYVRHLALTPRVEVG